MIRRYSSCLLAIALLIAAADNQDESPGGREAGDRQSGVVPECVDPCEERGSGRT